MSGIVNQFEYENRVIAQAFTTPDLTPFLSLTPECFTDQRSSNIHLAIRELSANSVDIDPVNVFEWLQSNVRNAEPIESLFERVEKGEQGGPWFSKLCDMLQEAAIHRHILSQIDTAKAEAQMAPNAKEARQTAIGRILALNEVTPDDCMSTGLEGLREVIGECEVNFKKSPEEKAKPIGIPTGFKGLDRILNGFQDENLYMLGAETKRGKTVMGCNLARNAAYNGKRVLYVSLEMNAKTLIRRILSAESDISPNLIQSGTLEDWQLDRLTEGAKIMKGYAHRIKILNQAGLSTFQLATIIRQMKMADELDFVIIDYMQLLRHEGGHSREREVAQVSETLVAIAVTNKVPILALTQLNETGQIRESRAVEHNASAFMRIEYQEDAWTEGAGDVECRLNVVLNRHNLPDSFMMSFRRAYQKFVE